MLCLSAGGACAQSQTELYYSVAAGAGICSIGDGGGSMHLSAGCRLDKNLCSVRILGGGELFGKSLNEYSILYGRAFAAQGLLAALGGGIGLVEGEISRGLFSQGKPGKIPAMIGLPIEAQVFWRPCRFAGIGLYGFLNINAEETFWGCNLTLQAGRLR